MALCIAGMHRSGTSMVARLLNLCGLDLGPKEDLLPPAPDNPEGFWENRAFLRLNDAILKELGGAWDRPPRAAPGWEDEPALRRLAGQAEELVGRFRGREPWGWKDPRNCLTLPLWRRVLPEVRVLICVRSPLAVAESLRVRDDRPFASALGLWLSYNRRLLTAAPRAGRVVTHYDNYLCDPVAELRRLLGRLGMTAAEGRLSWACASVRPSLAHHRATADDLAAAGAPAEVVACYSALCAEAGLGPARPPRRSPRRRGTAASPATA